MLILLSIIFLIVVIVSIISLFYIVYTIYLMTEYSSIPNYFQKKGAYFSPLAILCFFAILLTGLEKAFAFIPSSWGFRTDDDGAWLKISTIVAFMIAIILSSIASKAFKYLIKTINKVNGIEKINSILKKEIAGYHSSDISEYFSSKHNIVSKNNKILLAEIIEDSASKILNIHDEWQEGKLEDRTYIIEVNKQTVKILESSKEFASVLPTA